MALRLSASEIPKLLMWLEQRLPATFKLQEELKSHLRGKFPDLDFFVDRWPSPQAVTAVVDPNGQQVCVARRKLAIRGMFSQDLRAFFQIGMKCRPYYRNKTLGVFGEKGEALRSLLTHCPHLDWTQPVEFDGVASNMVPILKPLIQEEVHVSRWVLMKATPSDWKLIPVPDGMKISSVTDATVDIVNSTWMYRGPHSNEYIRHLARHFPSVVMTTACGQHVGHVLGCSDGTIGMSYVMPQFRRGGYGKAIISQIAPKYFSVGEDVFGYVHSSSPAMNLNLSLGFKPVGIVCFAFRSAEHPCQTRRVCTGIGFQHADLKLK